VARISITWQSVAIGLALAVVLIGGALLVDAGREDEETDWPGVVEPSIEGLDVHNVIQLYPSIEGGMEWTSQWEQGGDVLDDEWLELGSRDVRYDVVEGSGELVITGNTHRLYVREPAKQQQWRDVEITAYFWRGADDNIPYSGMTSVARTNHGVVGELDDAPCDSRGLSARLRNDGTVDFGKEVSHPKTVATGGKRLWAGELPRGQWIGYKHVVYDTPLGVAQQVWVDMAGGQWMLVAENFDDGDGWGEGVPPCAKGVPPDLELRGDEDRLGSESGLPNVAVYFRADGLWKEGLSYRWASVREIDVTRSN
jgi:hypothetical protein